ncbi:MAG: molybdenum ABC transporter ATP-binding protein [Pseudomonadota bacterium]
MALAVEIGHRFESFTLDVRFEAPAGVTALFGRSGSGKTSVVNAVAGLLRPDRARIQIEETVLADTRRWIPAHKRRLGYVFQEGRLFPHLSVRQNLRYGVRFGGAAAGFERVVDLLGLGPLLERGPGALSGGERQRVAIGRALLSAPRMLLLDEPLAALDTARKEEVLPYLEALRDEAAMPILYVSHALPEVARLATTVVALEAGRVVRTGPAVEVLSDPEAVPALGIRAAGAMLNGTVAAQHDDGLTEVSVSAGRVFLPRVAAQVGSALRIRIAAQDVILATRPPEGLSALNVLPAQVLSLRRGAGPGVIVQVQAGTDRLLARITQRSADALEIAPGVPCFVVIKTVSVARADVGGG